MKKLQGSERSNGSEFHFERPRISALFSQAVKNQLVIVCAGTGYGKTIAVRDFARKCRVETVWLQLSERDMVGARFWENFTGVVARMDAHFAKTLSELGFPDSVDKINRYLAAVERLVQLKRRILVIDDFHLADDSALMRFFERAIRNLPVGTSVIILSRSSPAINVADMVSAGRVSIVSEEDLRFTDDELAGYFEGMEIPLEPDVLREVMRDTEGWAFAINLVARSCGNAPGYSGYACRAMRANVFRLMETEVWNVMSEPLRAFLLRLSLISHLSADLVELLAGSDSGLLCELERQNAYVRRDDYLGAYLIHHLFQEFLEGKRALLPREDARETYAAAAAWCRRHGFRIDALSYLEKTGDYEAISSILFSLPVQIPKDIARFVSGIFDRAPPEVFETVELLAVLHVRAYMYQGLWEESAKLSERYEAMLLALPDGNPVKRRTLCRLYYNWSFLRRLMYTADGLCDFDLYVGKFRRCIAETGAADPGKFPVYSPGAWVNRAGSAGKGSLEEYAGALGRASELLLGLGRGSWEAESELARGELKFFQGDVKGAEVFITRALGLARQHGQHGVAHMALFYAMRAAVAQGSYEKAKQALDDIKAQFAEEEYTDRFVNHDISLAWYCCALGMTEKIPLWLRKGFSPYGHPGFIENFGNQMKARHFYAAGNYAPLLSYIAETREGVSFLLGRVEMMAMEACALHRMREKAAALSALEAAYAEAVPNGVIMPFVELGKDMRTLTSNALKDPGCKIPAEWLEAINRRAASYAKRQAHVICLYREDNLIADDVILSSREAEILGDLSQGLSRAEIASVRGLSINTVKMVIGNVHSKLGTENLADLIRIAVERKLIRK